MIGPTSEETRRWVAESRIRQGLSPKLGPRTVASLGQYLRNTLRDEPDPGRATSAA